MAIDVMFVQAPYREGRSDSFQHYNEVYARLFASFWEMAPYQEGFANFPNVPLWVAYLLPIVKQARFSFDYTCPPMDKIDLPPAKIYLLSCFTSNYVHALAIGRWIREYYPDSQIILGGIHATLCYCECAKEGVFDIVVMGEGERTLEKLLAYFLESKGDLESISGICWQDNLGVHVRQPEVSIPCLDELPLPDYTFLDELVRPRITEGAILSTKGCPWRCVYCAEGGRRLLLKSSQRVLAEAQELIAAFPRLHFFRFADSSFTARPDLDSVCGTLSCLSIPWSCQTRADLMKPAQLKTLRGGGCRVINVGAESGDNTTLKLIHKGATVEQIVASCSLAKQYGFKVITYWMIGLPGETRETARRTIATIAGLLEKGVSDLAELCICVPYPGTALYQNRERFKVAIKDHPDYQNYIENDLSCMSTHMLSAEEIYQLWIEGLETISRVLENRRLD